jgi:hypothetical protein
MPSITRRLRAALRGPTQDDDNRHAPQPVQASPQHQHHPGPAGFAGPYHHGQMAGRPPLLTGPTPGPAGPASGYSQPAMVSQPAMLPQPGVAPQQAMTRQAFPNMPIAGTSNTSSSQAAASLALTLRSAPQPKPLAVYCRWCERCKRGRVDLGCRRLIDFAERAG